MSVERKDGSPHEDWFASLVGAQLSALYLHVRLIYPFADTESTVLEVFGRARSATGSPAVGPRAWLRGLARQVALPNGDRLAARRHAEAATFGLQDTIESMDVDDLRPDLERLVAGLGELSVEDQELLRLSSVEDLDPDELAWILELDVQGLTVQLAAARQRLRAACSRAVDGEGAGGLR